MAEIDNPDSVLDAFNRRIIARRNLRCLDAGGKDETGKTAPPEEDEEEEKPPFQPG